MTSIFGKLAGVLGLGIFVASGAQALTTISAPVLTGGANVYNVSQSGGNTDINFGWASTGASGYVQFTATDVVDFFLTGYSGATTGSEYTGFILREVGGANLTSDYLFCNTTATAAPIRGRCNLATNLTSPSSVSYTPSTSTALMSVGPGTYYLGFSEANSPTSGAISFRIAEIATVPLPAGGLMLVGALGGLAALRRRKKAA